MVLCYTSGALANSRNCAKGPEYWCRDLATAKACGAVRHCQQTVWNTKENSVPSMSNHETADMLCNVLVEASTKLLADSSMDVISIKSYLRSDCGKLPNDNNLVQQVREKQIELLFKYFYFVSVKWLLILIYLIFFVIFKLAL